VTGNTRTILRTACLVGLCLLLMVAAMPGDERPPVARQFRGLQLLALDLRDGTSWVLGPGGLGRPFLARMLLTNIGDAPLRIWDPDNSEGSQCPSIILSDAKGKDIELRPAPIERSSGVPTVWTINPKQVVAINLEMLRLVGTNSPPPGTYKIRAFYRNTEADSATIKGVWTGHIGTDPVEIKIVLPAAK
jgi:hypothetical protein